jgi:hypothetical protein
VSHLFYSTVIDRLKGIRQIMEIIEVIDTVVKIGLGAIISGVATHKLARLNFDYDLRKKNIESNIILIKELSIKLEHAEALLNEATHSYFSDETGANFNAVPIIDAAKLVYESRAIANLLGEVLLIKGIGELAKIFDEIYNEFSEMNNQIIILELIKKVEAKKEELYPLVASVYSKFT